MPFKKKDAASAPSEAKPAKVAKETDADTGDQMVLDFIQQLYQSNDGVAARLFLDIYVNATAESHSAALLRAQQGTQALIKLSHIAT